MAREKSIAVRFAAIGGQAVKAEMRDIGTAGRSAMQTVAGAVDPANDRLEEMARAASQARAQLEELAAKAASSANRMRAGVPSTTPMQQRVNASTGVDRASAAATLAQGQALDDLRAKYSPLFATIQKYRTEVQAVRAAHADGAISANEQSSAIARLRGEALQAIDKIKGISAANREAAQAAREAAAAQADQAARLNSLRAQYNPIYRVISSYKAEVQAVRAAHADGAISASEMAAALSRLRQASLGSLSALKGQTQEVERMSQATRMGSLRMQQMLFQVNDIGVSLAGGQNPFVVMAQQGTQIAQIYGFGNGGVSGIFRDLGGLVSNLPGPVKAVGIALGVGALAVKALQNEINETSAVTVSFGDTALAVFQVIGDGIYTALKPAIDWIGPYLSSGFDAVNGAYRAFYNGIINGATIVGAVMVGEWKRIFDVGKAAFTGIKDVWGQLPAAIGDFAYGAANALIGGVESMLNAVVQRINKFVEMLNSALSNLPEWAVGKGGIQIGTLSDVSFGRISNPYAGGRDAVAGVVDDIMAAARQTNEGWANREDTWRRDTIGDAYDAIVGAVGERAQENARNRLSRDAKKGGGRSKGSGGAATEEKRAIDELVASLQQELSVLRTTDPIKKKMLEYSDQLKGATAAERAAIQGLVEELDRAENGWEAVGRKLSEYVEQSKRLGQEWGDVFVGAFDRAADAFATFVTTGKLNFSDLISSMAADIARLAFQEHIGGPLAGLVSGWLSGGTGDALSAALVNAGVPGVVSFDGGGHTGFGARSGGLDGKGGMMAMVHPNETITDNTKRGQNAAQGVVVGVDPRNGNITAYVDGRIGQMLPAAFEQYSRQVLPGAIRDHMRDPRAVG